MSYSSEIIRSYVKTPKEAWESAEIFWMANWVELKSCIFHQVVRVTASMYSIQNHGAVSRQSPKETAKSGVISEGYCGSLEVGFTKVCSQDIVVTLPPASAIWGLEVLRAFYSFCFSYRIYLLFFPRNFFTPLVSSAVFLLRFSQFLWLLLSWGPFLSTLDSQSRGSISKEFQSPGKWSYISPFFYLLQTFINSFSFCERT